MHTLLSLCDYRVYTYNICACAQTCFYCAGDVALHNKLPASFALLRQMRFCRRQYMPLDSAEDANVSDNHKIASFKPASLSPNRETFVGRGENEA